MEQARYYVCPECQSPVPSGQKFCGACGANVPQVIQDLQTDYFGAMQEPGNARLVLIRGDQGVDGLSYVLKANEHYAGSQEGQILFPDDRWLSPKHANFFYRDGSLVVRDESDGNGIYVRLRSPAVLSQGDHFLCGEQVFRVDGPPAEVTGPDADQTYFYTSPKRPCYFTIVQILAGGADGMVLCARERVATIGREDSDLNFPQDVFISGQHAKVEMSSDGQLVLHDLGSRNGTYVRVASEHVLAHGDYLFLGKQLLRVEITA